MARAKWCRHRQTYKPTSYYMPTEKVRNSDKTISNIYPPIKNKSTFLCENFSSDHGITQILHTPQKLKKLQKQPLKKKVVDNYVKTVIISQKRHETVTFLLPLLPATYLSFFIIYTLLNPFSDENDEKI